MTYDDYREQREEGRNECFRGGSIESNPYIQRTYEAKAWNDGFVGHLRLENKILMEKIVGYEILLEKVQREIGEIRVLVKKLREFGGV